MEKNTELTPADLSTEIQPNGRRASMRSTHALEPQQRRNIAAASAAGAASIRSHESMNA